MVVDNQTPNVNFFLNFYGPNNSSDFYKEKRKYYSSNIAKDYINYIQTGIQEFKDYVEYANNKEKSSGIFNQNGLLSEKDKKQLRERLRETQSVIWDGLITFEESFGKTWCNSYEQAYELVKSELPKFFKRAGLNPDNMIWYAGLHENTDNRHIHLSFFEKEPVRLRPRKDEKVFSNGKLSKTAILEFKAHLELAATDFKARERRNRQLIQEYVNEQLNENMGLILNNKLLSLAGRFSKKGSLAYASENMSSLRSEIDSITSYMINKSKFSKVAYEDFINLAKYKDERFECYCKRNRCKQPFFFEKKYTQDIYRRLGNIVIDYSFKIKQIDNERLKLNASVRREKLMQKKKLAKQLNECLRLANQFEYEVMSAFQEYMQRLDEAKFSRLVEEGIIDFEM